MTRAVTSSIVSLVEEDPDNHCNGVIKCGSGLLEEFCRLNWVGPYSPDLKCPYPDPGTDVVVWDIDNYLSHTHTHVHYRVSSTLKVKRPCLVMERYTTSSYSGHTYTNF